MDVEQRPPRAAGTYTSGPWLHAQAFQPATAPVRTAVADALEQRAEEVVAAVLHAIAADGALPAPPRLLESQAGYTRHGVMLTIRWVRTGEVASREELQHLVGTGDKATSVTGQITRMVLANLAFRDAVRDILREEVDRQGGSLALLLAFHGGVDAGFRRNLLQIGRTFDRRSRAFDETLAQKEAALEHHALHDSLTGLANRVLLFDRLAQAGERSRRHPDRGNVGVVFIDLDDFKEVNDGWGHLVGDLVLQETARRLLATVRPEDTVARLGGDEFVVICEGLPDRRWVLSVARRIDAAIRRPMTPNSLVIALTASIGTATGVPPVRDVDGLVREADDAMYRVKRRGKRRRRPDVLGDRALAGTPSDA